MAATTEELLQTILQSLEKVEYIKSEDIPNIDLYMDQVLTFMDRKLRSAVRPQTEDRILTKTMINNYAKNDLLPPPVKKKYSKEHVLLLIFIYYYKGIIPMNEIQTLLKPLTDPGAGGTSYYLCDQRRFTGLPGRVYTACRSSGTYPCYTECSL